MNIKKIVFKFKFWYITPLESDTILWYVFAHNFENLKDIFEDFKNQDIPFLITDAFDKDYIIRPFYIVDDKEREKDNNDNETELIKDLQNEADRKKIKKLSILPIDKAKQILELQFKSKDENEQKKYDDLLKEIINEDKSDIKNITTAEFKNSISRFNSTDTTPFVVSDITYTNNKKIIYVKIFDEAKYNRFFECLKNTFETIWFGAWKSRWYGKIKYVEEEKLNKDEEELFKYIEELKKEWKYIVLNNFKPSKNDIENIDTWKSFINLNHKNTKALDNMSFKWKMSFISAWSVVIIKNKDKKLEWDYYEAKLWDKKAVNFWYLF